jgi:steroid delta-isomerase-like uncharacterized protein
MGARENRDLVTRFYEEVFNQHRMETFDELVADDATDHGVPPGYASDKAGSRKAIEDYLVSFPDLKFEPLDVIGTEDRVAIRASWSGTNSGPLYGLGPEPLPATGRFASFETIEILGVRDGKLTDHWANFDEMGLMGQLGLMPPPGGEG